MPEPSILDERLAEIDRRLRSIQSGLDPVDSATPSPGPSGVVAEPAEPAPPTPLRVAPPPPEDEDEAADEEDDDPVARSIPNLVDELRDLSAAHERLLELHRELLSQYAEMLQRQAREAREVAAAPPEAATVALTAGPFSSAVALREFEHDLAALRSVADVAVREYLEGDRVVVEVRLAP